MASRAGRAGWRKGLAWAKIAISAGLLWLLFATYDFGDAADRLAAADVGWLGVTAVVYGSLVLTTTLRWRLILGRLGEKIAFVPAVGIVVIGMFFNQALPSNLGGDAMRIWRLHKLGSRVGRAFNSVMLDRVVAMLALAVLVLCVLPLSAGTIGDSLILTAFVLFILAVFAGVALLLLLDRIMFLVRRLVPARAIDALSALARDARTVLLSRKGGPAAFVLALTNHLLIVLVMLTLARSLSIHVTFAQLLVLVPPVLFATVVPLSFAGWGVREGAMVAMFGTIGVAADKALALSVAFGLVALAGSLPGGLVWLATGNRNRR